MRRGKAQMKKADLRLLFLSNTIQRLLLLFLLGHLNLLVSGWLKAAQRRSAQSIP
jgi:hypothetical protein